MKIASALLCLLFAALSAAQQEPLALEVGIQQPLCCLLGREVPVSIYLYNRSKAPLSYNGEPVNAAGGLVLTGAWDLVLEEVKEGRVIASRSLRPADAAAGAVHEVKPTDYPRWDYSVPAGMLPGHAGNYRFRLACGPASCTGRLFRIADTLATPDWLSLSYTPDKKSYFIGEPITVTFVMTNNGKDAFSFEEGGDYRGATRHLRYAFTAETAGGVKALDPTPRQDCMGGMGMLNPLVEPGRSYTKSLPLLAYLSFPAPGKYVVKAYQGLGFGDPDTCPLNADRSSGWYGKRAYGGSFEIEINEPSVAQLRQTLASALASNDGPTRRALFANLSDERFLPLLNELLTSEKDVRRHESLIVGIASIRTTSATRSLINCARATQGDTRAAALEALSRRIPNAPWLKNAATNPDPAVEREVRERRDELKAVWDDGFRDDLMPAVMQALATGNDREITAASRCLSMLGAVASMEALASAGDRAASAEAIRALYYAARGLAWLGAAPCRADRNSAPGRLTVWAGVVKAAKERQSGDWQDLLLVMMNSDVAVVRECAIENLPPAFTRNDDVPWRKLFLEPDHGIRFHAIQGAKQHPPRNLDAIVRDCLAATSDNAIRSSLTDLETELKKKTAH